MTVCLAAPPAPDTGANPPLNDRTLRAIERALRFAWNNITKSAGGLSVLRSGNEPEITKLLYVELGRIRDQALSPGYNTSTFERPVPAAEYYNYQDTLVRKPDLVFFLAGPRRPGVVESIYDGLVVECKIIGTGSRNLGAYSRAGILRFVNGEYACRMPQGMMCAYVRTSQVLPDSLDIYFAANGTSDGLLLKARTLAKSSLGRELPAVYVSTHSRAWTFLDGTLPGHIDIRHLWLPVN